MPQQNMSSKVGKSSSQMVNRVIQNSKGGQTPVKGPSRPKPVKV